MRVVKKIWAMAMIAAGTVALTAMTAGPAAAADARADGLWFHLQVHEGKEDAHVVINLPLSMVEKSAGFLRGKGENGSGRIRFNDNEMTKSELQDMWKELRRQKDTTFLSVQETDGKVKMAKRGNYLMIQATGTGDGKRENVEIKIPVPVVDALLSGPGEELNIAAGLQALVRAGEAEIMTVTSDDETVRMWIDDVAEAR
jgi:hypothetical protein